jgi:hypothetical protein
MGIAFFFDRPVHASALTTVYTILAISTASAGCALRQKLRPEKVRSES